jgi:O-antigen ligase
MVVVVGYILPGVTDGITAQDYWWTLVELIAVAGLLVERKTAWRLMRSSWPLLVILVMAVLSTAWSDEPSATFRRSLAVVGSGAISLWIVCRIGLRAFLDTLGLAIGVLAIFSVALVALAPQIGVGGEGWQGCFGNKNAFGQVMVIGIVAISCAMAGSHGVGRVLKIAALVFFATLLIESKSGTSIVVAAILTLVCPALLWARTRFAEKPKLVLAFAFAATILVALTSSFTESVILSALDKDETLTGRTSVWEGALDAVYERPVLGYGYKSFWLNAGSSDPNDRTGTWATQAHNGFLEIGLDLGVVGVSILVVFLLMALSRAIRVFWRGRDLYSAWPLFALMAFIITDLTEATMVKYNDVTWVIFVAAVLFGTSARLASRATTAE